MAARRRRSPRDALVRVEGLASTIEALEPHALYATPLRRVFDQAGAEGEVRAKQRAPSLSGRLQSAITHRVDPRPVPTFARAGVFDVPTRGSFRYPMALDASKRYHYRGAGKRGKSTRRWLTGVTAMVKRALGPLLAQAAAQIEASFARATSAD